MPDHQTGTPITEVDTGAHDEAHAHQLRGNRQLLIGRGIFYGCAYVVSAILARKLSAADYGIYGVLISQLLWLEMVVNGGIPGATAKRMAEAGPEAHQVERSAMALLLGFSAVLFGICWLLAPLMARLMSIAGGEVLFRTAIIDLPFAATYSSYEGVLLGRRRFGLLATAQALYGAAKVAGVIALIGIGFSIKSVLIANALATCAVCMALAFSYRLRGSRPKRSTMREIAAVAAPMALYLVSGQILANLDLWTFKSLWRGSGEIVGQYVASVNLSRTLTVIPAAQAGVLFASVAWAVSAKDLARARLHIQEASRFAIVIATAACVILGMDASAILSILFSSRYAAGEPFARLLLIGFSLYGLLDAFSNALLAAGRHWSVTCVLVPTMVFAWLCNVLLISRFGPLGAATSMVVAMAAATMLTGLLVYRHIGSPVRSTTIIRVAIAATVVGLIGLAIDVRGYLELVKVAALSGLYLLVLGVLGEITPRDLGLRLKGAPDFAA